MKFSIAAVALLVGNGLALTQEEQAAADQQAVGVQETPENTNEANDGQAADDSERFLPHGYPSHGKSHHGHHGHHTQAYGSNHGSINAGHGSWDSYGHHGPSGCQDDVRRVKATLKALLDQVDKIRCESCPKPTTHHHKPTSTYHRPTTHSHKPTSTYHKPTSQPAKPTSHYSKPTSSYVQSHYPTTTTKKACATPTCGKPGVKFNRYSNPFSKDFSSSYKTFDLGYFLKQKPLESGIVTDIALTSDPYNKTYANAAMEYRTFLFACQSGKYKFTSPKSDDITLMWFGEEHVKDSTRDNADILQAWYGENKPQTVYKDIKAGVYYPIRVLWGNTNGAGYLNLDIYAPNGQKLSGNNSPGKSYVVTENCQGNNPYGDTAKTASPSGSKPTSSIAQGSKPTSSVTQGSKPSKPTTGGSYGSETKKPSTGSYGSDYDSYDSDYNKKPSTGGSYGSESKKPSSGSYGSESKKPSSGSYGSESKKPSTGSSYNKPADDDY